MEHMSVVVKWWSRAAAVVTGAILTLVVPVHAWAASNGVGDVAIEAAKYRRRRSGFGFFGFAGALCCLLVVAAIVLVVLLIVRSRRKKP
jgi:ABC-type multidrug transport system permease subunit